jgi:hypothetical protein
LLLIIENGASNFSVFLRSMTFDLCAIVLAPEQQQLRSLVLFP